MFLEETWIHNEEGPGRRRGDMETQRGRSWEETWRHGETEREVLTWLLLVYTDSSASSLISNQKRRGRGGGRATGV